MKNFKLKLTTIALAIVLAVFLISVREHTDVTVKSSHLWNVESIDTMKFSRDLAREKLNDLAFDTDIDSQLKNIAATGANYVAIDTPYDEEFVPILERWVAAARRYNLHVWFRGNFSGWEQWFGYSPIDRTAHLTKTQQFLEKHQNLFMDGDIFTACPECENGGPGDPRTTGDVDGFRQFMIDEYRMTHSEFAKFHKDVRSNFDSMNYDVATLVMDRATTQAMDGVVVIDHYVASPEVLTLNIQSLAAQTGGTIMLGEFGAPIPDIHGDMTEHEQALWIKSVLTDLAQIKTLIGTNYWVNSGSSTELWSSSTGKAHEAVATITNFYSMHPAFGAVEDENHDFISGARIENKKIGISVVTGKDGVFAVPYIETSQDFTISAPGYISKTIIMANEGGPYHIVLKKIHPDLWYRVKAYVGSF